MDFSLLHVFYDLGVTRKFISEWYLFPLYLVNMPKKLSNLNRNTSSAHHKSKI